MTWRDAASNDAAHFALVAVQRQALRSAVVSRCTCFTWQPELQEQMFARFGCQSAFYESVAVFKFPLWICRNGRPRKTASAHKDTRHIVFVWSHLCTTGVFQNLKVTLGINSLASMNAEAKGGRLCQAHPLQALSSRLRFASEAPSWAPWQNWFFHP